MVLVVVNKRGDQQRSKSNGRAQMNFAVFASIYGNQLLYIVSASFHILNPMTSTLQRWSMTNALYINRSLCYSC